MHTGREYARILYRLLNHIDHTPASITQLAEDDIRSVEKLLLDFITDQDARAAPSYLENYIKVMNSWLKFNYLTPVKNVKLRNKNHRPTLDKERVPDKNELKQIFNYAKPRGKVSISFMAFSGLRPQVLGDLMGSDGLKLKDLPEMRIEQKEVIFDEIPTRLNVRYELSKNNTRYTTFLGPEGCTYLKSYLEKRLADGEVLTPESAVITYKKGYNETGIEGIRDSAHITTKTLTKEIRDAFRPKYTWRPYVLRSYFDTQLLVAENHGLISHPYRQFFMGHKGNIEAVYTTNKGILPEHVIEDMRNSYKKCLEYLETTKLEIGEDKLQDALRRQLLLVAGFSGEEIDAIDLDMSDEEFQELARNKLVGQNNNNGNSQKVIHLDELAQYLDEGWSFVATVNKNKAIIKIE